VLELYSSIGTTCSEIGSRNCVDSLASSANVSCGYIWFASILEHELTVLELEVAQL
jgi:hypothetical protein